MTFLFGSMSCILSGPYAPALSDADACRAYLRREGYCMDRVSDAVLRDEIIAGAKVIRTETQDKFIRKQLRGVYP